MNCFLVYCIEDTTNMFTNIPNHQRFLQQERFKVGVKLKQFLAKGARKPESELDNEFDGVNCDEVKRKIFDFAKTFIGGRLSTTMEEGKPVIRKEEEDITYDTYCAYVFFALGKNLSPLDTLTDGQLRQYSVTYNATRSTLVLKVFKYGPTVTLQTANDFEKVIQNTNRAGAPTENQHADIVRRLKEFHKDTYTTNLDLYWSMWATIVAKETDAEKQKNVFENLPTQLYNFFMPPNVDTVQNQFLAAQRLGSQVSVRALQDVKTKIDNQIIQLTQLSASLQTTIDFIKANRAATENVIALNHLQDVTEQQDIDHI